MDLEEIAATVFAETLLAMSIVTLTADVTIVAVNAVTQVDVVKTENVARRVVVTTANAHCAIAMVRLMLMLLLKLLLFLLG